MGYKIFTSIGLIFDILGVIMLFRYGLPSRVIDAPHLILMKGLSNEEIAVNSKIRKWAYTGLIFLIIGFVGQIAGVILQ
jgi:hypothetical protein